MSFDQQLPLADKVLICTIKVEPDVGPSSAPDWQMYLEKSTSLEDLFMTFPRRDFEPFNFHGQKFPSFRILALRRYPWDRCSPEDFQLWNFSKLEELELGCMPLDIERFLLSVSAKDLPVLKTFFLFIILVRDPSQVLSHPRLLGDFIGSLNLQVLRVRSFVADEYLFDGIIKGGGDLYQLLLEGYKSDLSPATLEKLLITALNW